MRIGVTGLLAVVTLIAAACGGGGGAAEPPSTSSLASVPVSSATATPAMSPTSPATGGPNVRPGERPPAMPAAAKQHTQEGALAFAGYFIRALDWSIATTDPSLLVPISSPSCAACNSYISRLNSLRRARGYLQGGRLKLISEKIATGSFSIRSDYVIVTRTYQEAVLLISPRVKPSHISDAIQDESRVYVVWARNGWIAVEQGGS
jgi:Family of unknown function (DUF6318)